MPKQQLKIQNLLILAVLFCLPFYFIKFRYGWVSLNLVEILIIILFLFWIFDKEKKYTIHNTQYTIPTVLIIIGLVLSIFINKNYYTGLGTLKGWFVFPIIFAVILYDNLKKDEKLLDKIFITLFASGAFVAVEGVYYWLSGLLTYDGRLRIFFDSPNQLAMYLAPVFLVGMFFFTKHITRNTQHEIDYKIILLAVGLIIISLNLYFTKSFGAWLAIGLTLVAIFWLKYRKIWSKKYLSIMVIILIISVGAVGFGKFENIKRLGDRSSLASREMIWKSAGLMIQKNPVFGIGPGNFQNTYLEYQKYFPPYLEWAVPQPHNLYLAFWLESGLLGLIGFVWLLILFFRDNKKVYFFAKINKYNNNSIHEIKKQTGNSLNDKEYFGGGAIRNNRLYGILCLAVVLYFLIHGLIDTTYWRNDMAVVFWAVVAANIYLADSPFDKLSNSDLKSKSENIKTTTQK